MLFLTACISPQPKLYQSEAKAPAPADTTHATPRVAPLKLEVTAAPQSANNEEVRAQFTAEGLSVKILVRVDENYHALGQRILHHPEDWHLLPLPAAGASASYLEVPFAFFNYTYKKRVLALVFPKDTETDTSWVHVVNYADETWGSIAEIFSNDEEMADLLLQENGFDEEGEVRLGQVIKIPARLLQESLRRHPLALTTPQPESKPAPQPSAPAKPLHSQDPELKLIMLGGKTYGTYRLKRGEALYSAVVVRFTGRVDAEEVNQIARELLVINGIADASKIAIGTEIKIPLELLDEALLSEEPLAEVEIAPSPTPRHGRKLHVILDAGHGGEDPGTMMRDLREDEIAFDLMRRIREGLISRGVEVHPLVSTNGKMTMTASRKAARHEYVNVTPAYYIADGRISVNLRIYLIDALYRKLLREGVAAEDIIFMSIHLDHLHPSVGGTMIYVPGASQRAAKFKASEDIFDKYAESRGRTLFFPAKENRHAERASLALSQTLMAALRKARLPIHAHQPIRKYVYRGGKKWTPGIIRYNRVPNALLIEAANFSNRQDQKRIRTPQFRQQFANAIVEGVLQSR